MKSTTEKLQEYYLQEKVYDKVTWHYPEGKGCPDLKCAKVHFQIIMKWLDKNGLLSSYGKELYSAGVSSDFALTSDMLTDVGKIVLDKCYKKWISTITYGEVPNTKILDDTLKSVQNK
jgi:hypothetical protein